MRNYLFDTDVLISILRGKDLSFKRKLETLRAQKAGLWVSVISLGELYHGAFKSENPPKNLALIQQLNNHLRIVDIDDNMAFLYGEIQATLEKSGEKVGDFDVLIACAAIQEKLTLVSGNARHFQRIVDIFGQLKFEVWN